MATRAYFGNGTPPVSPAFDASWEVTASASRRMLEPGKDSTGALASLAAATTLNSPAGAVDVLIAQFVSPPMTGSGTISGSISGQIRALESATAADLRMQTVIRVFNGAGSSVVGTLVASSAAALASEWPITTATNRKLPLGAPVTPSSVAYSAGDRIVVELGYRKHESATTSRTGTLRVGNPSGTDLAVDETTTTDDVPWIEFADAIAFDPAPARVSGLTVETVRVGTPAARVSGLTVETVRVGTPAARVSGLTVEFIIARPVPGTATPRAWGYIIG